MKLLQKFKDLDINSLFRIGLLTATFFGSVTYVDKITQVFVFVLFILGIYIIYKKFKTKEFKYIFEYKIILLFLLSFVVSSIFNCMYGLMNSVINFIAFFSSVFLLIIFFGMSAESNNKAVSELYIISKLILYSTVILNILGLILLFIFQREIFLFERRLVIFENRFIGLYSNPNLLSFSSVCGNMCSIILLSCKTFFEKYGITDKYPEKYFIITGIVLNSLSIFLSASNAGILFTSCFFIGIICYYMFANSRFILNKKIIPRTATLVCLCFFIPMLLLGLRTMINTSLSYILSVTPEVSIEELIPTEEETEGTLTSKEDVSFDHLNTKLDSGRFNLLKKAGEYIKQKPVFGFGKGKPIVDTFKNGKYIDFHNGYVMILVSMGIVGFSVFLTFGIKLALKISVAVFAYIKKTFRTPVIYLFAFICAYCVYSAVERTLMFELTFMIAFFWFVLGVCTKLVLLSEDSHLKA